MEPKNGKDHESESEGEEGYETPTEDDSQEPVTPISETSRSEISTTEYSTYSETTSSMNTSSSMSSRISELSTSSYSPEDALTDLPYVHHILELFLSSRMVEAEDLVRVGDPRKERLYFSTAWSLIQAIKAMMSFDDAELESAIEDAKHTAHVAQRHRKSPGIASRLTGLVAGHGVSYVKGMTPVERHAELVYAETLLIKAVLGIVSSGDWLAFVKEALNMRSALNIYRQLSTFIDAMDMQSFSRGQGSEDKSVDQDFRSGVCLGMGLNGLVLSLLPSKVITIVELFGYKADRTRALQLLAKPGGWSKTKDEPSIGAEQEGIRRCVCDMALIMFHLVINSITFAGVDVRFAEKMLKWELKRFPDGVFFLFMQGRLHVSQAQPRAAIAAYERAANIQKEYVQLQHVAYWEEGLLHMAMAEFETAIGCWRRLVDDSSWSKAVYSYCLAACLTQTGKSEDQAEAIKLMELVPTYRQRIAGKSIPVEKFAARKARKYKAQSNRLLLPVLEFITVMQAMGRLTPKILEENVLPQIRAELTKLRACQDKPQKWGNGMYFWDDFCLARFMEGVCLRYIAYSDPDAVIDVSDKSSLSQTECAANAVEAFQEVIGLGPKIELDHYIVYYSHYDLGRLHACMGDRAEGKRHLEMVMSGKPLEIAAGTKKGKYSLENSLMVRTHAAIEAIDEGHAV